MFEHTASAQAPNTEAADCPREALRHLPSVLQLPLTYVTGKPYHGQRGPTPTPTFHLLAAMVSLVVGMMTSALGLNAPLWWGIPTVVGGWMVTLHGMRNLRMMIFHQCAHRNMWRLRRADQALGRFLAGLLVIQGFDAYSREHTVDHHAVHHMTVRDPTVQAFLLTLGLRPGMSREQMWRVVIGKLLSPRYHARFLTARVKSCWLTADPATRALMAAGYVVLAALLTLLGGWTVFLVGWIVPLTALFQISNTLRLCVKHTFPQPGQEGARGREHIASLTNAIFLCSAPPDGALRGPHKWGAWVAWWARLSFVHFPSRYLVLTGDTICHDYHHRYPMSPAWADYIFARQRDIENGHQGWPPYQEAWGLVPAINRVFESLSRADADAYSPARIADVTTKRRAAFLAFDD